MPQSAPQRALKAGPFVPAEVTNLTELTATPLTDLPEGFPVWIQSLQQEARLGTSSAAVVQNQIVASLDPTKRWFLQPYPQGAANAWIGRLDWGVSATGSNEAAGTPAAPLASFEEFERRMGGSLLNGNYNVAFTTGAPAGLTPDVNLGPPGTLVLTFLGAATVVAVGAVGAGGYVTPVPATPEYCRIQAAATLAPYTGLRCRITSGLAAGAVGWFGLNNPGGLGVTWSRVNRFYQYDPITNPFGNPLNPADIVPGDTFVVETLAVIANWHVTATKQSDPATATNGSVSLMRCSISSVAAGTVSPVVSGPEENPVTMFGCQVYPNSVFGDNATWMGCRFEVPGVGSWSALATRASFPQLFIGCLATDCVISMNAQLQDFLSQGSTIDGIQPGPGLTVTQQNTAVFDAARDAVRVDENAVGVAWLDVGALYGSGSVGYGVHIIPGGCIANYYNVAGPPRVTATINDLRVAGDNGGGFPLTCTWAAFAAGAPAPLTIPGNYVSDLGSGLVTNAP